MRLLHTADWHLGQTFFEYDRKAEHIQFLDWLRGRIKDLAVDALLIAGDVFDSPNPSAESQRMFYQFLRQVTIENPSLQIVVIAGNHDSAARLEAPSPLLDEMNIAVRGIIRRTADGTIDLNHLIVPLSKGGEVVAYCLAVPYLRQGDYPEAESYPLGVRALYEALFRAVEEKGKPVVAMGHLQATGSEISENDRSERTIIGGLECISPDSFAEGIVYTALGHLHRGQRVSKRENIRYSGTPVPMSFAEKNNKHGAVCVDITEAEVRIEAVEFDVPVKLMSIPVEARPMAWVLEEIALLPQGEVNARSPYLEIKILMTEPEPSMRYLVEEALKGKGVRLTRIVAVTPQRKGEAAEAITYEELQAANPMDIAADVFRKKYGGSEMPDTMRTLLQSVIREVEL